MFSIFIFKKIKSDNISSNIFFILIHYKKYNDEKYDKSIKITATTWY